MSAGIPPEVETIRTLVRISGILSLVIGIINLIWGVVLLVVLIGIIGIAFGIIDIWLYYKCSEIIKLIDGGELKRAKNETLIPMILGFIFSWIIVGILLLIAYIKYDEVIRTIGAEKQLPPPPKF